MRKIMSQTGPHENLKTGIWPKCATTTTKLEKNMVIPQEEKCAHKKLYGKMQNTYEFLEKSELYAVLLP